MCNNCTGGVILHELGFRFDTSTINTWIPDSDFLRFAENISFYRKQKLCIVQSDNDYVVGRLHDVYVHFMHETDAERAVKDWCRRVSRIDENNLYCVFVAGRETSHEAIKKAAQLPLKHICALTEMSCPDIQETHKNVVTLTPKRAEKAGGALNYINRFSLHKRYDVFDFKAWLK